jgi:hypothetical protein
MTLRLPIPDSAAGERRVLAGAGVAEPLIPFIGVVGPLLQLDPPEGSGGRKNALRCAGVRQRGMAALACDTSSWVVCRNLPQSRGSVRRRGDDALAVGAERRAQHPICMAFEWLADWLAGLRVPQPSGFVLGHRDDASAVGAERSAQQGTFPACERPADHSRTVLSPDAVTMRLPAPSWPLSGSPMGWPVSASHSRTVLSPDAVTMRLPSGLNAALKTQPVWPSVLGSYLARLYDHSDVIVPGELGVCLLIAPDQRRRAVVRHWRQANRSRRGSTKRRVAADSCRRRLPARRCGGLTRWTRGILQGTERARLVGGLATTTLLASTITPHA